jgi:hypothetical protein
MIRTERQKKSSVKVNSLSPDKRKKISTYGHPCYDSTVYDKKRFHKEIAKS